MTVTSTIKNAFHVFHAEQNSQVWWIIKVLFNRIMYTKTNVLHNGPWFVSCPGNNDDDGYYNISSSSSSSSRLYCHIYIYTCFRAEQRVSSNLIGWAIWRRYIHRTSQWIWNFCGLATKHASLAILASKHGGQLVNEFFTYLKDITLSPGYLKGWRIFWVTAVIPGLKIFPTTRVQGS